jgi:hypothetical protein
MRHSAAPDLQTNKPCLNQSFGYQKFVFHTKVVMGL